MKTKIFFQVVICLGPKKKLFKKKKLNSIQTKLPEKDKKRRSIHYLCTQLLLELGINSSNQSQRWKLRLRSLKSSQFNRTKPDKKSKVS
jgi:hypothetical protein